jgi:hypothetical protein
MKKEDTNLLWWWNRSLPLYIILVFEGIWMALFFSTEIYYLSQAKTPGFPFLRGEFTWLAFHFASPIAVFVALEHVRHKDLGWGPVVWNFQSVLTDIMSTVISFQDFPDHLPLSPNTPVAGLQLYQALALWGLILSFATEVCLIALLIVQRVVDKKPVKVINHSSADDEVLIPPSSRIVKGRLKHT